MEDHEEILFYLRALHGFYYNLCNNNDLREQFTGGHIKLSEGFSKLLKGRARASIPKLLAGLLRAS